MACRNTADRKLQSKHYDYFLFGHRHLPMTIDLGGEATYINTGDWIHYYTYAVFDWGELPAGRESEE